MKLMVAFPYAVLLLNTFALIPQKNFALALGVQQTVTLFISSFFYNYLPSCKLALLLSKT
jgi:hypothetical protein